MQNGLDGLSWQDEALCAKPANKKHRHLFFSQSPDEKQEARTMCFACPVRWECLKWALENKEIWGVWGGKDETEIRRTLSVSHTGQEMRRSRFPNCPYCGARPFKLDVIVAPSPEGGRWATMKLVQCSECDFTWRSRTSANAVAAYKAARDKRKKKKSRKQS